MSILHLQFAVVLGLIEYGKTRDLPNVAGRPLQRVGKKERPAEAGRPVLGFDRD
jgi:hypothetical protein